MPRVFIGVESAFMWFPRLLALISVVLVAAATPLVAIPEVLDNEDLAANRQAVERARLDPPRWARLNADFQSFMKLPLAEQQRFRRIDADLRNEVSPVQARLLRSLDRYNRWLERLPAEDRRRVEEATTKVARLKEIRKIREQQWVERAPANQRSTDEGERQSTRATHP